MANINRGELAWGRNATAAEQQCGEKQPDESRICEALQIIYLSLIYMCPYDTGLEKNTNSNQKNSPNNVGINA